MFFRCAFGMKFRTSCGGYKILASTNPYLYLTASGHSVGASSCFHRVYQNAIHHINEVSIQEPHFETFQSMPNDLAMFFRRGFHTSTTSCLPPFAGGTQPAQLCCSGSPDSGIPSPPGCSYPRRPCSVSPMVPSPCSSADDSHPPSGNPYNVCPYPVFP